MKYILLLCLILPIFSFAQIDARVNYVADSIATLKTDSLAKTLDSSVTLTVFTTDATPINVDTLSIPTNSIYDYLITVLAANTASGDGFTAQYNFANKHWGSGYNTVRYVALISPSGQGTIASAKFNVSQPGIITITGVKGVRMKWVIKIEEVMHIQ